MKPASTCLLSMSVHCRSRNELSEEQSDSECELLLLDFNQTKTSIGESWY